MVLLRVPGAAVVNVVADRNVQGESRHLGGLIGSKSWAGLKSIGFDTAAGGIGFAVGYAQGGWDKGMEYANMGRQAASLLAQGSVMLRKALLSACFAAGTPLLTPNGHKPIEEFLVGDLLLSRSEFDPDGPVEAKQVEEVFVRTGKVLHLHVGGQIIKTTQEHPFWVKDKGWIPACELLVGDLLSTHDGRWVPVEDLHDTGEYETLYNLRVRDFATYFVGGEEWRFSVWAHNAYSIESKSYASSDQGLRLRQEALKLRSRYTEAEYRNIATADVTINGKRTTVKFINTPDPDGGNGGIHSEQRLTAWVDAMRTNGKSVEVNAVYTDRRPCPTCNSLLTNCFGSDLTVYHAQGPGPFQY